ncbi:MAG: GyrI-like domain-containing protein [Spirochaetales bacterium]|nr:GyrI-like domain-containing protein [Spirochaetales bacterium]
MKQEWRKTEKGLYLPKARPEIVDVPDFRFLQIQGEGHPGSSRFAECITALFSLSYALKMSLKKRESPPEDYTDYTVYPLEGVWDLNEQGRAEYGQGTLNKDHFVYTLMIRQPSFISDEYFSEIRTGVLKKKPQPLQDQVELVDYREGKCIQMLHTGSFDSEPASFARMEAYAEEQNLQRLSRTHREIYLSDFRKTEEAKLKTVLRFRVDYTAG